MNKLLDYFLSIHYLLQVHKLHASRKIRAMQIADATWFMYFPGSPPRKRRKLPNESIGALPETSDGTSRTFRLANRPFCFSEAGHSVTGRALLSRNHGESLLSRNTEV